MNKEVKVVPLRHVVVVTFKCGDGVQKGIREAKRAEGSTRTIYLPQHVSDVAGNPGPHRLQVQQHHNG